MAVPALIRRHRVEFPDDDRSDSQLTYHYIRQYGPDAVRTTNPDLYQNWRDIERENFPLGIFEEIGGSLKQATYGLGSTAAYTGALGADLIGWDSARDTLAQEGLELEEAGHEGYMPTVGRVEEIDNANDFGRWLLYAVGQVVPSGVEMIALSAAGAAIGTAIEPGGGTAIGAVGGAFARTAARKLLKDAATKHFSREIKQELSQFAVKQITFKQLSKESRKLIGKQSRKRAAAYFATGRMGKGAAGVVSNMPIGASRVLGGLAGGAGSYVMNTGEIVSTGRRLGTDWDDLSTTAAFAGALAAAPDTILGGWLVGKMFPRGAGAAVTDASKATAGAFFRRSFNAVRSSRWGTVGGVMAFESATEWYQELINISANKYARGEPADVFTDEEKSRLLNAAAIGAVGGVGFGGFAAAMQGRTNADGTPMSNADGTPMSTEDALRAILAKTNLPADEQTKAILSWQEGEAKRREQDETIDAAAALDIEADLKVKLEALALKVARNEANAEDTVLLAQILGADAEPAAKQYYFAAKQKATAELEAEATRLAAENLMEGVADQLELQLDEAEVSQEAQNAARGLVVGRQMLEGARLNEAIELGVDIDAIPVDPRTGQPNEEALLTAISEAKRVRTAREGTYGLPLDYEPDVTPTTVDFVQGMFVNHMVGGLPQWKAARKILSIITLNTEGGTTLQANIEGVDGLIPISELEVGQEPAAKAPAQKEKFGAEEDLHAAAIENLELGKAHKTEGVIGGTHPHNIGEGKWYTPEDATAIMEEEQRLAILRREGTATGTLAPVSSTVVPAEPVAGAGREVAIEVSEEELRALFPGDESAALGKILGTAIQAKDIAHFVTMAKSELTAHLFSDELKATLMGLQPNDQVMFLNKDDPNFESFREHISNHERQHHALFELEKLNPEGVKRFRQWVDENIIAPNLKGKASGPWAELLRKWHNKPYTREQLIDELFAEGHISVNENGDIFIAKEWGDWVNDKLRKSSSHELAATKWGETPAGLNFPAENIQLDLVRGHLWRQGKSIEIEHDEKKGSRLVIRKGERTMDTTDPKKNSKWSKSQGELEEKWARIANAQIKEILLARSEAKGLQTSAEEINKQVDASIKTMQEQVDKAGAVLIRHNAAKAELQGEIDKYVAERIGELKEQNIADYDLPSIHRQANLHVVEQLEEEAKALKAKDTLSKTERTRLNKITAILESADDVAAANQTHIHLQKLLESAKETRARGGTDITAYVDFVLTAAEALSTEGRAYYPAIYITGDGSIAARELKDNQGDINAIGRQLTSQARVGEGVTRTASARLAIFRNQDGVVHIGSIYATTEKGEVKYYVMTPRRRTSRGKLSVKGKELGAFMGQGWEAIGSIRLSTPLSRLNLSYDSVEDFRAAWKDAITEQNAARGWAEGGHFADVTIEDVKGKAVTPLGTPDVVAEDEEAPDVTTEKEFTSERQTEEEAPAEEGEMAAEDKAAEGKGENLLSWTLEERAAHVGAAIDEDVDETEPDMVTEMGLVILARVNALNEGYSLPDIEYQQVKAIQQLVAEVGREEASEAENIITLAEIIAQAWKASRKETNEQARRKALDKGILEGASAKSPSSSQEGPGVQAKDDVDVRGGTPESTGPPVAPDLTLSGTDKADKAQIIKDNVGQFLTHLQNFHAWRKLLEDSDPNTDNELTGQQKLEAEQELYRQLNRDEIIVNREDASGEINSREVADEAIADYDIHSEEMAESWAHQLSKDLDVSVDVANDIFATIALFAGKSEATIDEKIQDLADKHFPPVEAEAAPEAGEVAPMVWNETGQVSVSLPEGKMPDPEILEAVGPKFTLENINEGLDTTPPLGWGAPVSEDQAKEFGEWILENARRAEEQWAETGFNPSVDENARGWVRDAGGPGAVWVWNGDYYVPFLPLSEESWNRVRGSIDIPMTRAQAEKTAENIKKSIFGKGYETRIEERKKGGQPAFSVEFINERSEVRFSIPSDTRADFDNLEQYKQFHREFGNKDTWTDAKWKEAFEATAAMFQSPDTKAAEEARQLGIDQVNRRPNYSGFGQDLPVYTYNHESGQIDFTPVLPDTAAAAMHNISLATSGKEATAPVHSPEKQAMWAAVEAWFSNSGGSQDIELRPLHPEENTEFIKHSRYIWGVLSGVDFNTSFLPELREQIYPGQLPETPEFLPAIDKGSPLQHAQLHFLEHLERVEISSFEGAFKAAELPLSEPAAKEKLEAAVRLITTWEMGSWKAVSAQSPMDTTAFMEEIIKTAEVADKDKGIENPESMMAGQHLNILKAIKASGALKNVTFAFTTDSKARNYRGSAGTTFTLEDGISKHIVEITDASENVYDMLQAITHELIHAVTVTWIAAMQEQASGRGGLDTINRDFFKKAAKGDSRRSGGWLNPQIWADLNGTMQSAKKAWEGDGRKKFLASLRSDYGELGWTPGQEEAFVASVEYDVNYGLKDVREFTTMSLTSYGMRLFLESISAGQGDVSGPSSSLWGNLKLTLRRLWKHIFQWFHGKKAGVSLLDQATDSILKVIEVQTEATAIMQPLTGGQPIGSDVDTARQEETREAFHEVYQDKLWAAIDRAGRGNPALVGKGVELGELHLNYMRVPRTTDALQPVAVDPNIEAEMWQRTSLASAQEFSDILHAMYDRWTRSGGNTTQFGDKFAASYEDFLNFNLVNVKESPEETISLTLQALHESGGRPGRVAGVRLGDLGHRNGELRLAALMVWKFAVELQSGQLNQRTESEAIITKNTPKVQALDEKQARMADDFDNLDNIRNLLEATIEQEIPSLVSGRFKYGLFADALQVLSNNKAVNQGPDHWTKVIREVLAESRKDATFKFYTALTRVANANLNWEGETVAELDKKIDPLLKDLDDGRTDHYLATKALVITFLKRVPAVSDLLRLRTVSGMEEVKAKGVIRDALRIAVGPNAEAATAARRKVKQITKLTSLADQLLTRIEKMQSDGKNGLRVLNDKLRSATRFIEFHEASKGILAERIRAMETLIGGQHLDASTGLQWQPIHGADYHVAPTPNATLEELRANTKTVSHRRDKDKIIEDIKKNIHWLDQNKHLHGGDYELLRLQTERLGVFVAAQEKADITQGITHSILQDEHTKLKNFGTETTAEIARRLYLWEANADSWTPGAIVVGERVSTAEGKAMKALGLKSANIDEFRSTFYDGALKFFEDHKGVLYKHGENLEAAYAEVFTLLRAHYSGNPELSQRIRKDGAWEALINFWLRSAEATSYLNKARIGMGLKVLDKGEGYEILREAIGAPLFTMARSVRRDMHEIINKMESTWKAGTVEVKQIEEEFNSVDEDGVSGETAIEDRYAMPDEVWRRVLEKLVRKVRPFFLGLPREDKILITAPRDLIEKAFVRTEAGNTVGFAINLYEELGGDMANAHEKGLFVGQTLESISSIYGQFKALVEKQETMSKESPGAALNNMLHARQSEAFPAEWLEYHLLNDNQTRQQVRVFAFESSFGLSPNTGYVAKLYEQAKAEFTHLREVYANLIKDVNEAKPFADKATQKREVKIEAEKKGYKLKELEKAHDHLSSLKISRNLMMAFLTAESSDQPMELRFWSELISTLAGYTVQGATTGMIDTISAIEQPLRKMGISGGLRHSLRWGKNFASTNLGSLIQVFHTSIGNNSDINRRVMEMGYIDPDTRLGTMERFSAAYRRALSERDRGKLAAHMRTGVRVLRAGLGIGFGRAKEGEVAYPTFKPHAIFSYVTQQVHRANVKTILYTMDDFAIRATRHFQNPKNSHDRANLKYKLTHKDVGFSEKKFTYLYNAMQEAGIHLETVARNAADAKDANPNHKGRFFTVTQDAALAVISVKDLTLDGSTLTRPMVTYTNKTWSATMPLIGWQIQKSHDVLTSLRTPRGELTWKSFYSGLKPYALILPLGLFYALMRDKWEEEVIGKKANVLGFGGEHSAALVAADQLSRVGTFGLGGEAVNALTNFDTAREMSVDSRVLFVSTALNLQRALTTWFLQGEFDYAGVGRPLLQAFGLSGYLQNYDTLSNISSKTIGIEGPLTAENRTARRIHVYNLMRAAGRGRKLDVRVSRGMRSLPNPIKPSIKRMTLAAFGNDAADFSKAYQQAIKVSLQEEKAATYAEAQKYVREYFLLYHPLRFPFKKPPTTAEYQSLLGDLSDTGRQDVAEAINLFNSYAQQIGGKPYLGSTRDEKKPGRPKMRSMRSMRSMPTQKERTDAARQRAVGAGR